MSEEKKNQLVERIEKLSNPILISIDDDGKVAEIKFIDGRKYKLTYPSNRIVSSWRQQSVSLTEGFQQDLLMDKFFEHVVSPIGHTFKPTVDNVSPKEYEVWTQVQGRFLRGKLEP